MHNQDAFGQWDDRWIGAATPADVPPWDLLDVLPPPELDLSDVDLIDADDVIMDPLSVPETLLAASLVGPGPQAQRLLHSLLGCPLSRDQALTAVQLWEQQEAWLVGQKQLALVAFAGQTPTQAAGFRDDEETVHELAPAWGSRACQFFCVRAVVDGYRM